MKRKLYQKTWLMPLAVLLCFNWQVTYAGYSSVNYIQQQQKRTITGQVKDETGQTLPGVNISIKGTTSGSVTDINGNFKIDVPSGSNTLVFSFLGFNSQEVNVSSRTNVNVVLTKFIRSLDEAVVIGYGSVKKSDLTGSVSSIKADELSSVPVTSFDQALVGRSAGVQVTQTSGTPGGETNIRIRGTSSINASSEPLYVIDGVLVNSNGGEMSIGGVGPRIGPLSGINPNDIESIEVLKDASATAIYGSRGANGVILITTKRGKAGKSTLEFDSYYGFQEVGNKLELLNGQQYAEFVNEAQINAGKLPVYLNPASLGEGTDWQDAIFQTAPIASYQLSTTGGTEKTTYAISGGYFTQDGIIIGSDFDRYSFRVNLDNKVNDKVTIGNNLSYTYISSNGVRTGPGDIVPGIVTNAIQFNPNLPVYNAAVPGGYTFQHDRKDAVANPVADALEFESLTNTSRILGNVFLNYKILEGLEFRTSFGVDGLNTKSNTFAPNFLKRSEGSDGSAVISTLQAMTWLNENTLTYNKEINKDHKINVLVGQTLQKFSNENLVGIALGFDDNRTGWHSLGSATNPQNPINGESEWSMVSYLGRINYNLFDKFLITLSGRVDGSSKFPTANKYGFFPSGALAWRMSDEKFIKDIEFISDMKLRVSYGVIGNQSIPPYQSLALVMPMGEGLFNVGNNSEVYLGRLPGAYPNPDLKWESTKQANIGLDLSFLNNRITFTADAYQKKTFDLLLSSPIPNTTGFDATLLNIGNIQNNGFEFDVRTVNTTGKLKWNSSLNFSVVRNKVLNLAQEDDINLGFGNLLREGEPVGTFYGFVFDGIFQTDAEAASSAVLQAQNAKAGDRRYRDLSGPAGTPDGVINEFDRTIIGSAQPDFTWGLNNDLSYKNFGLSFFLQGSQGNEMVNMNLVTLENPNAQQNVLAEAGLNRWTPTNPSNKYPRALSTSIDNAFSSRLVEDASFIRLRSVSLSYNLPAPFLQKIGVSNCRIYVSGANLWTSTNYSGYNPEGNAYGATTNIVGVDSGGYPLAKTYMIGTRIGF